LKSSSIEDDSIGGYGSIVASRFKKSNIIITGTPVKIVKTNTYWKK